MRRAEVFVDNRFAGELWELEPKRRYRFSYENSYDGQPVSLLMPLEHRFYEFEGFPPFFEGLLPEGAMLDALLRIRKIDRDDFFAQLIAVGEETIGNVSVKGRP